MAVIDSLAHQQFINLETFRKNGIGVKTPVWFVRDGDTLFVRTIADSGKVKRVRATRRVQVAPCKADGSLLGEWLPAQARELKDLSTLQRVDSLMDRKYGLLKKLFSLAGSLQGSHYTVLEINTGNES